MGSSSVRVRLVCQALLLFRLSLSDQTWHMVDVPSLICGTGTDATEIKLWNLDMNAEQTHTPHVIAFFRSSERPVSISYTVVDSSNVSIELASGTETLVPLSARRLVANASAIKRRVRASGGRSSGGGSSSSGRSSSGGSSSGRSGSSSGSSSSSSSSGRRSYTSAGVLNSARRRGIPDYYQNGDTSRRRLGGEAAYRRRGFQQEGSRRRMTGYDGERWGNSRSPLSGNYGLTSSARAARIFPNDHSSTGYGYAGAGAFAALGVAQVAFSASALGLVAAAPQESRWGTLQGLGSTCSFGSYFEGDCGECTSSVWDDHKCSVSFAPAEDMNLDMIMTAGFIPTDITWPLLVRITRVDGDDYASSRLCASGDGSDRDLFVTLAEVEELEDDLEQDSDGGASSRRAPLYFCLAAYSLIAPFFL